MSTGKSMVVGVVAEKGGTSQRNLIFGFTWDMSTCTFPDDCCLHLCVVIS